jgi:serine/threonine-protein kinase HipA
MPRAHYEPLNVFLNSRVVGQLRRELSGAISFQYDPSWLDWEFVMPVSLSLPLRKQAYSGAPVVAVFDNLLPDNDDLRRKIAARARAEGTDAYSLLSAIGRDCVGALQFLPPEMEPGPAGVVDGEPINNKEIAAIIGNLAVTPLGLTEDASFRISIAGAQEKTALLYRDGKWYKPRGTTATTHVFKPSIGRLSNGVDLTHSAENEYCGVGNEGSKTAARRVRRKKRADRRTIRPEVDCGRKAPPITPGRLLPGAIDCANSKIPGRWRPRHCADPSTTSRK